MRQPQSFNLILSRLILSLLLTSCSALSPDARQSTAPESIAQSSTAGDKPTIVASYSVLCYFTERIAQDTAHIACPIAPGTDPHSYTPKPSDRQVLETAQLILYGGYQFDSVLANSIEATRTSAPKVAVNEEAVPQPLIDPHHHHEEHSGDRAEKNENAQEEEPDPHIWHDAKNAIAMVSVIRDRLIALNPSQTELYTKNAAQLTQELQQLDGWVKAQIATIPESSRTLITTHDALGYYVRAYGLKSLESLQGLSSDESPTPARVAELVELIRQTNVPTIFAEVTANDRAIATVAREAQIKLSDEKLLVDGLGAKDSDTGTYAGMMKHNTCAIVQGLGGQCNKR
jgi:manganese/iron transport system substrate-binding protein